MNVTAESLSMDGATLVAVEVSAYQSTLFFETPEVGPLVEVNVESSAVVAHGADFRTKSAGDAKDAGLDLGRSCLDLIGKTVSTVESDDGDLIITFGDGWKIGILAEGPYESYQVTVRGDVVLVR